MRDINLTDDYGYKNSDVNIDVYDDMCGCPEVLVNFKEETLREINKRNKTVKEYYLKADLEIRPDTEEVVHENFATGETEFIDIILKGKGDIDWSKVKDEYLDYDDGYGSQVWSGWITFTDGTWIERHEYDGSEWWEYKETPSLENVKED